jgi:ATP-dependent exoDNAse (exonuclease V) beta subunit
VNPSELEGAKRVPLEDLLRLDSQKLQMGSILHALFEHILWIDGGVPGERALCEVAMAKGAGACEAEQAVCEFMGMIKQPEVRKALLRSTYTENGQTVTVHRELPFALRDGNKLVSGVMDRVVVRKSEESVVDVEVLDYKTDGLGEETLSEKVERYRKQIEVYKWAAMKLFGVDESHVSARLLFVRAGKSVGVGSET